MLIFPCTYIPLYYYTLSILHHWSYVLQQSRIWWFYFFDKYTSMFNGLIYFVKYFVRILLIMVNTPCSIKFDQKQMIDTKTSFLHGSNLFCSPICHEIFQRFLLVQVICKPFKTFGWKILNRIVWLVSDKFSDRMMVLYCL